MFVIGGILDSITITENDLVFIELCVNAYVDSAKRAMETEFMTNETIEQVGEAINQGEALLEKVRKM